MLRRRKPLRAKVRRIKPVSDKRRKLNEEYSKVRKEYLAEHPRCEICGQQATDIHHKKRRGKHLLAKDTFMACCRPCHNRIESNPGWARENGYLIYEYI
jgi:hypothetical protein